jgi:aryl-alcohol dehydrogenase-like predicted oxidoreductase
MKYRILGSSGLHVSTISLGTMTFGGDEAIRGVTLDQARAIVDTALESGINLIDTADAYSGGDSERIVGEVIQGRRSDVILATKVRFPTGPGVNDEGLSRKHILASCDASLRRLQTDYIDLYQLHGWDGVVAPEETMSALAALVASGKVREVGCSNFSGWHIMKSLHAAETVGGPRHVSQQIYYSLLSRDAEYELLPAGLDQNLGTLIWSPLAGGLLTGKYRRGQPWPEGARHSSDWDEPPIHDWDRTFTIIDQLVTVAEQHSVPPAQVALAYLLNKPFVTSVIVGARSVEQLKQTLPAADLMIGDDGMSALNRVSVSPLPYPYWHQARTIRGKLGEPDTIALSSAADVGPKPVEARSARP